VARREAGAPLGGRIADRLERPIVLLAAGAWLGLAAQLLDLELAAPGSFAPYHYAQLAALLLGLAGCAAWAAGRRGWRPSLMIAAAVYLVLWGVRVFIVYTWKFLDTDPWPVAIYNTFTMQWLIMLHFMADGWLSSGIVMLFYEWLMPLAQAIVLGALAFFKARSTSSIIVR
jgi:hypothetical protein